MGFWRSKIPSPQAAVTPPPLPLDRTVQNDITLKSGGTASRLSAITERTTGKDSNHTLDSFFIIPLHEKLSLSDKIFLVQCSEAGFGVIASRPDPSSPQEFRYHYNELQNLASHDWVYDYNKQKIDHERTLEELHDDNTLQYLSSEEIIGKLAELPWEKNGKHGMFALHDINEEEMHFVASCEEQGLIGGAQSHGKQIYHALHPSLVDQLNAKINNVIPKTGSINHYLAVKIPQIVEEMNKAGYMLHMDANGVKTAIIRENLALMPHNSQIQELTKHMPEGLKIGYQQVPATKPSGMVEYEYDLSNNNVGQAIAGCLFMQEHARRHKQQQEELSATGGRY